MDPMETLAVKSCLQMDFAEDLVRNAVNIFIARNGHPDFKAKDIAHLCFVIEDQPGLVNQELASKVADISACEGDRVRCYSCEYEMRKLKQSDVAMEANAKLDLKCSHICPVKKPECVYADGREGSSQVDCSTAKIEEQQEMNDPMATLAVKSCLEVGFAEDDVREAVALFIARHGHTDFKGEDIAQLCFDIEDGLGLVKQELNANTSVVCASNYVCCTINPTTPKLLVEALIEE